VATSPSNPTKSVCKRVTAIGGDTIVTSTAGEPPTYAQIPQGYIWIEGDNKHQSYDSREYGPIPIQLVQGKAIMRIWPISMMGRV